MKIHQSYSKMIREIFVLVALAAVSIGSPVADILPEREGRIIGGSNANLGQFPYQVSLRTATNFHFCGGVMINTRWVLTAARCTAGRAQNSIRMFVGSVLLNSGGTMHLSSRIVIHPSFNADTIANDISLVQTATFITLNGNVQPIALGSAYVSGGVNAVVTGWGSITTNGVPTNNQLQQLATTTLTNADCLSRHTFINRPFVFDHKICTVTQAGQGFCSGDDGGPLVAGGTVIGIVSWNVPCARGFPDVFERVSTFRTWILNTIA